MKLLKQIRRTLPLLIAGICFAFTIPAYGAEEEVVDGSRLTYDTTSTGEFQNVLRGAILNSGRVVLTNKGDRKINCYGNTTCLKVCDRIELEIYLERSSGGGWSSYTNWKYSTTNDAILSRSNTITVPGGYYYRLRGYYACEKSGYGRESNSSFTDGIWIP